MTLESDPTSDAPENEPPADPADAGGDNPDTPPGDEPPEPDWKAQSRKHEREKKKALAELAELRKSQMSDSDRAIEEAKAAGRAEALAESSKRAAAGEFRAAAAEAGLKVADIITLVNLDQFVTDDGEIDQEGITAAVSKFAAALPKPTPASPTPGPQGPPTPKSKDFLSGVFG